MDCDGEIVVGRKREEGEKGGEAVVVVGRGEGGWMGMVESHGFICVLALAQEFSCFKAFSVLVCGNTYQSSRVVCGKRPPCPHRLDARVASSWKLRKLAGLAHFRCS